MIVAVAGTFNVLHEGHIALLKRAFSLSKDVCIGITSDRMASETRTRVNPYYIREKAVREYLKANNKEADIFCIDDMYGPEDIMADVDVLVVSDESLKNGKKVIEWRSTFSDEPLKLSVVRSIEKDDGSKITQEQWIAILKENGIEVSIATFKRYLNDRGYSKRRNSKKVSLPKQI